MEGTMDDTLEITYRYTFADQRTIQFPMVLHKETLALCHEPEAPPPSWAGLDFSRCGCCPLDPAGHPHCPIAVNLDHVVEAFKEFFSFETVQVTVTTAERSYAKTATIQEGLSALLGIVMVTSGCPVMERLKPMVRFHLPFASIEESTYRMLSMYLVAQLYRHRQGLTTDWDLEGLDLVYGDVGEVNESFSNRLRAAAKKDANINAMVNLDCLAKLVPFTAAELLEEMEGYFSALKALQDR
jgi:hypothetical protein